MQSGEISSQPLRGKVWQEHWTDGFFIGGGSTFNQEV